MKIKKYQNPSGTLTPEREAEIRAEQQAALNELWEKRNAYAKQEEQERKQHRDALRRINVPGVGMILDQPIAGFRRFKLGGYMPKYFRMFGK